VDNVIADTHHQPLMGPHSEQPLPETLSLSEKKKQDEVSAARPPPPSSERRASKLMAYQQGQEASFLAILDEVEQIEQSQASKGLSDKNFTFGLMNCLLVAYTFGAHPEHFWILYLLGSCIC
jgi:hypothetical protein